MDGGDDRLEVLHGEQPLRTLHAARRDVTHRGSEVSDVPPAVAFRRSDEATGPAFPTFARARPFIRWSRLGVFDRIFAALVAEGGVPERLMIDSTHLKAHRTAASLLKKGLLRGA